MKRSQRDGSAQIIIVEGCDKLPDTLVSSLWVFSFERYSLRCLFDLLNSGMLDLAKSNSLVVKTASRKLVINLIIHSLTV